MKLADNKVPNIPVWEKKNLTLKEAACLYGIGINKLRNMTQGKYCKFVLFVGNKRLIKRVQFEEFLSAQHDL